MCNASGCDKTPVMSWQRYATPQEIAEHVPPWHDSAGSTILVYACADHLLTMEQMAVIHHADCSAPPECTCPEPEPQQEEREPSWQ